MSETAVRNEGLRALVRANIATVAFEVVVPMVVFYGLRLMGVGQWWALMAGIAAALPHVVLTIVRQRRVDLTAAFTLSILLFSVGIGLLTGDPRALVIREGWVGALLGLLGAWMLVTVWVGRPAMLVMGNSIAVAKSGVDGAKKWAGRWDTDPEFRHGIRVLSVAWGATLVADTVIHVVLVYTLPIDLVGLVTNVQWYAVLACLLVFHTWYVKKAGIGA